MFRIVTLNANGIRSACSKGLFRWLKRSGESIRALGLALRELAAAIGTEP